MQKDQARHVTYADAGVDVDEGARAVEAIKGAVKATSRPEVIGGLGGFGSCFSMKSFKSSSKPAINSGFIMTTSSSTRYNSSNDSLSSSSNTKEKGLRMDIFSIFSLFASILLRMIEAI